MKRHITILLALVVISCTSATDTSLWYVQPSSELNSIQAALDLCSENDTILVAAGTYYENLVWPTTHGIKLISESGSDVTIIDADGNGCVIIFDNVYIGLDSSTIDSTTIIDGFTITHGGGPGGSGILIIDGSPFITNNRITENTASCGAGMDILNASPKIVYNVIINNTATVAGGGGIRCYWNSSAVIRNNIITENTSTGMYGAGIDCAVCLPIIDSNEVSNNFGNGISYCEALPDIHYNNILGNTGYGICNRFAPYVVDAEYNWWGDSTGPYHPDSNPGGLGDSVSDHVNFVPWLTESVDIGN